jgi:hypothetical protein
MNISNQIVRYHCPIINRHSLQTLKLISTDPFLNECFLLQDFKREVGLWHSIISSVFNGMHVIFIPYALMKVSH